jgi:hypothetical protein
MTTEVTVFWGTNISDEPVGSYFSSEEDSSRFYQTVVPTYVVLKVDVPWWSSVQWKQVVMTLGTKLSVLCSIVYSKNFILCFTCCDMKSTVKKRKKHSFV